MWLLLLSDQAASGSKKRVAAAAADTGAAKETKLLSPPLLQQALQRLKAEVQRIEKAKKLPHSEHADPSTLESMLHDLLEPQRTDTKRLREIAVEWQEHRSDMSAATDNLASLSFAVMRQSDMVGEWAESLKLRAQRLNELSGKPA